MKRNYDRWKRHRLEGFNYSSSNYYFVTICSKNRENTFGEIVYAGGVLGCSKLSFLGEIIKKEWEKIPLGYEHVILDEYVIMPNHIHGILIIDSLNEKNPADARPAATLSDIICSFKSKCSVAYLKYIDQNELNIPGKIWQRSFYDHIIRNEQSLKEIREYICNNPFQWDKDSENPINISRI